MNVIEDRYLHDRLVTKAEKSKKNHQKNRRNRGWKNRPEAKMASLPVKTAISTNKGSDLLLPRSNKSKTATARPQLLREGETIYLREQRRPA